MNLVLDTSVIIAAFTGSRESEDGLRLAVRAGCRLLLSALVLYEWRRGPRLAGEVAALEAVFPSVSALPFGPLEATTAAGLYREVRRPRGREIDLALAACAIEWNAALWTLNPADFADIPGLRLWAPPGR